MRTRILSPKEIREFQKTIWKYYKKHGRDLPWCRTQNPYRIVVSEIMLQQTQVSRVLDKYKEFLRAFPSFKTLAQAKQSDVLRVWQGLGYNRRALALQRIAVKVVEEYKEKLPQDPKVLKTFPGIGEASASSIVVFAFNKSEIFIETNIRSVFIHFFFKNKKNVYDKDIFPLIEQTLDTKNPRKWYFALMDYGVMLKKGENPSRKSVHHIKQKPFKESDRYIRGYIIKLLIQNKKQTLFQLQKAVHRDKERIEKCLHDLNQEGFLKKSKNVYSLVG
ncbi:MAG: A/G-specific adenine glycosylase [Candidatus Paceibacterota bacterium]